MARYSKDPRKTAAANRVEVSARGASVVLEVPAAPVVPEGPVQPAPQAGGPLCWRRRGFCSLSEHQFWTFPRIRSYPAALAVLALQAVLEVRA